MERICAWYDEVCEGPLEAMLVREHEDGSADIVITDVEHLHKYGYDKPFELRTKKMTGKIGHDDYRWDYRRN